MVLGNFSLGDLGDLAALSSLIGELVRSKLPTEAPDDLLRLGDAACLGGDATRFGGDATRLGGDAPRLGDTARFIGLDTLRNMFCLPFGCA